ncbi:hypothetical protein [Blastomonas natatoria]|uniref:hypothetical protein n=1 Tax=Blastomonas natatoria TaxID=34015 RepID=UPI00142DE706|nr:hypothetical protein [Blastomonas natatoria]
MKTGDIQQMAGFVHGRVKLYHSRHTELVSGPIAPDEPMPRGEKWTLKQVQGDG